MFINKNQRKEIEHVLKATYGYEGSLEDFEFVKKKERVFMLQKGADHINLTGLRVEHFGLYFGEFMKKGFRLSVEGSQIVGPESTNIINLDNNQLKKVLNGESISYEKDGFFILKHKNDFYGSTLIRNNSSISFIPKGRMVKNLIE